MKQYIFILFTLFITYTYCIAINSHGELISRPITDLVVEECVLNKQISSCQTVNNYIECPSISKCFSYLAFLDPSEWIINIPTGTYEASDCPGTVSVIPNSVDINILSIGGPATFNCGSNRFLDITVKNHTSLFMAGLTLSGSSTTNGGCINIKDTSGGKSALYFLNVTADGCTAKQAGGAVYASNIGTISAFKSNFYNNVGLVQGGGAIFAYGPSNMTLFQSNFIGNSGSIGGVVVTTTINIVDSYFANNRADQFGGVVSFTQKGYISNSSFVNNLADNGGGVIASGSQLFVNLCYFKNNTSPEGAAIAGTNMVITSSEFYAHTSKDAYGFANGGVISAMAPKNQNKVVVTVNNSTFSENYGDLGGVLYVDNVSVFVNNSTFTNNVAIQGGSIYAWNGEYYGMSVNVFNSVINNNIAHKDGGAIFFNQEYNTAINLNLTGTTLDSNSAGVSAGGFYFDSVPDVFVGGVFTNSKSSDSSSNTFNSKAISNQNIVYFINDLPEYSVPIFIESSFKYWKVFGAKGSCSNGVATINQAGDILSCKQLKYKLHFTK